VCGKKLDIIDELTVENIDEKTTGKKRKRKKKKTELAPKQLRRRGIIINAIRIAVILLVAFAVYLTQQTPSLPAISTSDRSRKSFLEKKRQLRGGHSVMVTQKELNSYVAGLLPKVEDGKVVKFDNVQVALGNDTDDEEIAIRMYVRVFGKKMLFQLFGRLEQKNGHMKFSPATFGKIGKLPYPAFLMKRHCKGMLKDLKGDKELFDTLTEATVKKASLKGGGTTAIVELKASSKS
jgi:hypothetical protein